MKLIFNSGTFQVFKSSNAFGDLILKFVEVDGGDYFTLTFQEGDWPEMSEANLIKLYRAN